MKSAGIRESRRRWRGSRCLVAVALLAVSMAEPAAVMGACWRPPVAGEVIDPFRPPRCPWCAGNRGLEYRTGPGAAVRAVSTGRVTFSGVVAGTRYVVVELGNGWRITYGRLAGSSLRRGSRVLAGTVVGNADGRLFLGVRVDGSYVDPAPLLGRLVGTARLVPIDGSTPRAAPPPRLSCRE